MFGAVFLQVREGFSSDPQYVLLADWGHVIGLDLFFFGLIRGEWSSFRIGRISPVDLHVAPDFRSKLNEKA